MRFLLTFFLYTILSLTSRSEVLLYIAPPEAPRSFDFSVFVNGMPVDLYGAPTQY